MPILFTPAGALNGIVSLLMAFLGRWLVMKLGATPDGFVQEWTFLVVGLSVSTILQFTAGGSIYFVPVALIWAFAFVATVCKKLAPEGLGGMDVFLALVGPSLLLVFWYFPKLSYLRNTLKDE